MKQFNKINSKNKQNRINLYLSHLQHLFNNLKKKTQITLYILTDTYCNKTKHLQFIFQQELNIQRIQHNSIRSKSNVV